MFNYVMNINLLIRVPFVLLTVLFSLSSTYSQSNLPICNCTVNAGMDKQICEPGGAIQLNGTATGNPLSYKWTPSFGLSNPNIKNPVATVSNTTTYTLTIECLSNINIVDNADFQQGNTGFTSDYTNAADLIPEGLYAITTNPALVHPGFAPCSDHTGGGNMMVVNGAGTPGLDVWCQTIPVTPNTDYAFETWVTTVVNASPALLQFSINGGTIGPVFQAPAVNCQWVQFTATWNSGSSNFATICIVNQNTTLGGNDFALDDISFKEICLIQDDVNITVNPIQHTDIEASICEGQTYKVGNQTFSNEGSYDIKLKTWKNCDSIVNLELSVIEVLAVIDPPDNLDCGLTEIVLHGDQSSFGSEYTYKWTTTNGHIVSDPTLWEVIVDKPGTYKLTVTYSYNGITCTKSTSVLVSTDYTKPKLNAGKDGLLTCNDSLLTLHGMPINPINNYSVNWFTPNGKIVSKTDTLDPLIGSPGMYIMQLTSNYNGCTAYDTVLVTTDSSLPLAIIDGIPKLNCYNPEIWLDGTKSNNGPNYNFQWNTNGGAFDSKVDSLKVKISTTGEYSLTVIDKNTGCKTIGKITITSDFQDPLADAGLTDTLSCQALSLDLLASSNVPDSIAIYKWSTNQGKILGETDTLSTTIAAPGVYYFSVQNKLNGCLTLDSVIIAKDINVPTAYAGLDDTLTCVQNEVLLNATGSSAGSDFIYEWKTLDGKINGASNNINAVSDTTGTYVFTVYNQLNGCKSSDTVIVLSDKNMPVANAGLDNELTCKMLTLVLDGTNSSLGNIYKYQWLTQNGNIVSGDLSNKATIDKAGIYAIEVLNTKNGCVQYYTVNVTEDKLLPDVTVIPTIEITCKNPQTNLSATNNDLTGASFTYLWTTNTGNIISGANSLSPLIGMEGTYTLITTNDKNGCTDSDDVLVNNLSELPIVNAGIDTVLTCKNTSIVLNGTVSYSGQDISIGWTSTTVPIQSGNNTYTPIINGSGIYTLTIIDTITGCVGKDEVMVTQDTISPKANILIPDKLSCKVLSIDLNASIIEPSWEYLWSTINGNIVSSTNSGKATVDKIGLYQLVITDSENGCSSTLSTTVLEDKKLPVVDAGPSKLITCTQLKVKLEGKVISPVNNINYYWTKDGNQIPGSNILDPQIDQTGVYMLVVTDELNGCTASDTAMVTKNTNVPVSFTTEMIPPGCVQLGSVSVKSIEGGDAPYQFSINGGSLQPSNTFKSLKPGTYILLIQDKNGCELEDELTVPEPGKFEVQLPTDITIEFGLDQQLHPIMTLPVNLVDSVSWTPIEGLSCNDCMEPFASPINTTQYKIFVTDKTGCTATAKVRVYISKDFDLYIPNVFSPNADGINDLWHVFGDLKKVVKIKELRIFDRWGENMFEAFNFPVNDPAFGWNGKSRGKYLNPAVFVYYLIAEFADGSERLYKGDINLVR